MNEEQKAIMSMVDDIVRAKEMAVDLKFKMDAAQGLSDNELHLYIWNSMSLL